jgi:hypothetical protein
VRLHHSAFTFDPPLRHDAVRAASRFSHCRAVIVLAISMITASCAVTAEDNGAEQQVAPAAGSIIAPPSGAKSSQETSQIKAAKQFLADPDAESVDYAAPGHKNRASGKKMRELQSQARGTDSEVSSSEGGIGSEHDGELGRIERELNLETDFVPSGPVPSFSLGTAKIKRLYRNQQYESALIETNTMLEYYPRSPLLLMMKGTLHQWLGQIDLALAAYRQAAIHRPSAKLKAQIRFLEIKVSERERLKHRIEGEVIPLGAESIDTSYPGFDSKEPQIEIPSQNEGADRD